MTTHRLPHDELGAALRAPMAARRELGPDYDEAFAQSIVERLEEALDARTAPAPRRAVRAAPADRPPRDFSIAVVVITLAAAIPLSAIGATQAGMGGLLTVWLAIVAINLGYQFRPRS
ncbi:hypothetical protein [Actinomadura parmotrematis]|uniref:DUF1707 domain-containing protein n=1 Tax=Actinomadura parmotrematis TaxID=2864039 RepID=A0ABS7FS25_9ACTN|nr:hypothetical protein [Actinomadura parmotrematis]MBW8483187.1 hypothetical protein [Actinomadura parmotrematis]